MGGRDLGEMLALVFGAYLVVALVVGVLIGGAVVGAWNYFGG